MSFCMVDDEGVEPPTSSGPPDLQSGPLPVPAIIHLIQMKRYPLNL